MIILGPARKFDTIMIFLGIKFKNIEETFSSKIAICDNFG